MSDETTRSLERDYAATGDQNTLEKLKRQWLRSVEWRECQRCGARVPNEVWHDHQAEHRNEGPRQRRVEGAGVDSVQLSSVRIPTPPGPASRPRKMPLYDHEWLGPGISSLHFFRNTSSKPLWRTNFPGPGGSLPIHWSFFWYGLSLVPDAEADPDDVLRVWDRSTIRFSFGYVNMLELPSREITAEQPRIGEQEEEKRELAGIEFEAQEVMQEPRRAVNLRSAGPVRDVTINGRPIHLEALQQIEFALVTEAEVSSRVGLMLVLYGLPVRSITG